MNKIIFYIVMSLIFTTCHESSKFPIKTNKIEKKKSKQADLESVRKVQNQNALPFEDFLKKFGLSNEFQKNRIKFPLMLLYSNLDDTIDTLDIIKSNWNFIPFKKDKQAYKKKVDGFKVVQKKINDSKYIYLRKGVDNGIHIEYLFERLDSLWYLTLIQDKSS